MNVSGYLFSGIDQEVMRDPSRPTCNHASCLADWMLGREPSLILYRARVHLGAGREDELAGQVAILKALTILRFLETKIEGNA